MYIKQLSITNRTPELIDNLLSLWQKSVHASHHFLLPTDIAEIYPEVLHGLEQIPHLFVAYNEQDEAIGFAGLDDNKLEMLFIAPAYFRKNIGSSLLQHIEQNQPINYVDVNEQNPPALAFYQKHGFTVFKRSDFDSSNRPFPILYMKR